MSYFDKYDDPPGDPVSILPLKFALQASVRLARAESEVERFEREAYEVMAREEEEARKGGT